MGAVEKGTGAASLDFFFDSFFFGRFFLNVTPYLSRDVHYLLRLKEKSKEVIFYINLCFSHFENCAE